MDFRLLGPLEVLDAGRPVSLGSPRQRAVLGVLAVHANEVVPASQLIDSVWEDSPPQSAVNLVQGYVSNLRKALGKDTIATRGTGYQLFAGDEEVDAGRFERAVQEGSRRPPEEAAELLREGLALWRGPALADLDHLEFARIEGGRLDELRLAALESRIEADLALGRHLTLVGELDALARRHLMRERLHRLLMIALYRSGRQSEALEAYQRARKALDELGIEPSTELRRLEQAILVHDPSLDPPSEAPVQAHEPEPAAAAPEQPPARPLAREERKVVTVMAIEVVDTGPPGERLDPEEIAGLHDPYVARIRAEVEGFGGMLETFVAGAAVAYFGAAVTHEDDPERAVRAGLAIQEALSELHADLGSRTLGVKIGIGTGEALVRLGIAGDERAAVVISDAVNLAVLLRARAEPGTVVVAESTYRETERAIQHERLADLGFDTAHSVAAWQAVGRRWRYGFRPQREVLTPLVGREEELGLLRTALTLTRRERSERLITILGEPGIGKSRLVHELFDLVEESAELIYWRQGRSVPYGEGVAYWALGEMVKAHAGISETDSAEDVTSKLSASVREIIGDDQQAQRIEDHLGSLVGAGERAGNDRSEAFAAWRGFFEALADRGPTVLVFEDLHWADDGLLDFVEHLTEWAAGMPLLLVCVAWPNLLERRPSWGRGARNSLLLALEPLAGDEQTELATRLCEATGVWSEAAPTIARLAGGSPLFTEEYVRMLADAGSGEAADLGSLAAPRSVQAVISARLDALPVEEKALLQDAAVVGTIWWRGAVEAIGGVAPESALRSLERKRLIRRGHYSTEASEVEYSFSHALVRDVAYRELPRAQRGEKHRRCAELIASTGPGRHDLVEFAAYHYLEALALSGPDERPELEDRARITLREAGDRAATLFSYSSATRFYEEALRLWPEGEPGRGILLHDLGYARTLSASSDAAEALGEAVDVLLEEGDRAGAARAAAFHGISLGWSDFAGALRRAEEALALLDRVKASPAAAHALADVAAILILSTEPQRGLEVGRRAVEMAERFALRDVAARIQLQMGFGRCQLGELEGRTEIESVIGGLEPSPRLVLALIQLAFIDAELGNLRAAAKLQEQARMHAEAFGNRHHILMLEAKRAIGLYWTGEWTAALAIADELLDESAPSRSSLEPELRTLRGQIALARGDGLAALEEARSAVALGRSRQDLPGLRVALGFAARAEAQLDGRADSATEILRLWEEHGATHLAGPWVLDLAWAALELDLRDEFRMLGEGSRVRTLWLNAATALVTDNPLSATDLLAQAGADPAAAEASVFAGRALLERGARKQAVEILDRAISSLEAVGAEAYLQAARELFAAGPAQGRST